MSRGDEHGAERGDGVDGEVTQRHGELTFTGPATFFKAPYQPLGSAETPSDTSAAVSSDTSSATSATSSDALAGAPSPESARYDAGLLGVPIDFAVGYRPGARFAPAAIRQASGRFALPPEGYYDFATDSRRLVGARLLDAGDVDPNQLEHTDTRARITAAAQRLRRLARLPLFIGGDHSISYPLLEAFAEVDGLAVVQLDAHLDFSDQRNGTRFSNSSPFRRAAEALPSLGTITTVGLRGMRADAEAFGAARERGHALESAAEVHADLRAALARLPDGAPLYLSIDVDVLDPAELPGTSSPEPEGLGFSQVVALIRAAVSRNRLLAVDLTELSPELDPTGRSALLAARLLGETLAAWWDTDARKEVAP